ncbi:MAG: phosphatidylserine decarboxylase [Myxococcales bacterium]|nr:phosphatidylserine decarboxylase [Myxococcales bacterium]
MAPPMKDALALRALGLLPKNMWSRAIGHLAHLRLPEPVAGATVKGFARLYGIDVDEAEEPLTAYPSIGAFFTRRLKPGARPIDRRPGYAVSPADGHILNSGRLVDGALIQAKGRDFRVADLLRDEALGARFAGGSWVTVYLSPKDYHRVHHPVEGAITQARYMPGHLWPVNRLGVEYVDDLFCVNERLATFVEGPLGLTCTIMVGATSVGKITTAYDADLQTNQGLPAADKDYGEGLRVARGDELGTFHLGSTAIVLFANPTVEVLALPEGSAVRMGEPIAQRRGT